MKQKSIEGDDDEFDLDLSDIDENDDKTNSGIKNIALHQTPNRMSKNIISYYKFQNDNDIVFKKWLFFFNYCIGFYFIYKFYFLKLLNNIIIIIILIIDI